MSTSPKKLDEKYTYKDYLSWDDDERWELIDGIAYNMSPAPSRKHQEISGLLFRKIGNYLEGKGCSVYAAPFDVRLRNDTVVQPDISVFCDKKKLDDRGAVGAPDLIIEILSPNTAAKDLKEKYYLYERVKVKEYWIIDPTNKTLLVYEIDRKGQYRRVEVFAGEDKVKVGIFKDLEIELKEVFKGSAEIEDQ